MDTCHWVSKNGSDAAFCVVNNWRCMDTLAVLSLTDLEPEVIIHTETKFWKSTGKRKGCEVILCCLSSWSDVMKLPRDCSDVSSDSVAGESEILLSSKFPSIPCYYWRPDLWYKTTHHTSLLPSLPSKPLEVTGCASFTIICTQFCLQNSPNIWLHINRMNARQLPSYSSVTFTQWFCSLACSLMSVSFTGLMSTISNFPSTPSPYNEKRQHVRQCICHLATFYHSTR